MTRVEIGIPKRCTRQHETEALTFHSTPPKGPAVYSDGEKIDEKRCPRVRSSAHNSALSCSDAA